MRRPTKTAILLCVVAASLPRTAWPQLRGPHLDVAIDRYVEPLIALGTLSGVVLVARNDSILSERAYGLADAELNVPITRDNAFRIASVSKSFTRALVGRLVEKGVFALSTPLSRWLPTFPSSERITLQMLLDHRAGVANQNSLPYDEEAVAPHTLDALIDALTRTPLDFPADSTRRYSNGGYAALAYVIEKSTGRPYEDALADELLKPIGLLHTQHQRDGELIPRLAHGMMPSATRAETMDAAPYQEMVTKTGGGSMVSTSHDLLEWANAIGQHPVLSRAMWKTLFPNDSSFALDGRCPGYMSMVLREGDVTVVVLANNYDAMVSEVGAAVMAMAKGRMPNALPVARPVVLPTLPSGLVGEYRVPAGTPLPPNSQLDIRHIRDHLVALVDGVAMDVLIPQSDSSYLLRNLWSIVTFGPSDANGAAFTELKPINRNTSFRAHRVGSSPTSDTLAIDTAISVYEAALRFYSPLLRQLRWVERPAALNDTHFGELLDRLGSKFQPMVQGEALRATGGLVRVGEIREMDGNRWRVAVWYRHHQGGTLGPESMQTFEIERRDGKFVIISRT